MDTNPEQPSKRPLPPELRFLVELPDFKQLDEEEHLEYHREQQRLIVERADLIRAHGLDPEELLAYTADGLARLEETHKQCLELEEDLLQAHANKADIERDLFVMLRDSVEEQEAVNPFATEAQDAREVLDEWAKRMPKDL
jgi:hypothetical protein